MYLSPCTHIFIFNPRRACAARVTVVILCVCLSACLSVCLSVSDYSRTTGYEAAYERYQQLQCYIQGYENERVDCAEMTAFERYGVKTSKKANMHNQHWLTTRFGPFSAPWTN